MGYKYHLTKVILITLFWWLYQVIPMNWVFLICGIVLPPLDFMLSKNKYLLQFPWELYLFYGFAIYSVFFQSKQHMILLGVGYSLSRLVLYFRLKH